MFESCPDMNIEEGTRLSRIPWTKDEPCPIEPEPKPPITQECPKCGEFLEPDPFIAKIHNCEGTD